MSEHKYRLGQANGFFPERGIEHTAKARFEIVRPVTWGAYAPRYRIKHEVRRRRDAPIGAVNMRSTSSISANRAVRVSSE